MLQLVPAVTELLIAEIMYLQYKDRSKPMFLYINSTGTTRADGETVSSCCRLYILFFKEGRKEGRMSGDRECQKKGLKRSIKPFMPLPSEHLGDCFRQSLPFGRAIKNAIGKKLRIYHLFST